MNSKEFSELLSEHKKINRTIKYTETLIDEQRQLARNAETTDDEEAYSNSVLRLQVTNSRYKSENDDIESKLIKDVIAIENALDEFVRIGEEIGRNSEQIETYEAKKYVENVQGIENESITYHIERLKHYRDDLMIDKARAETVVREAFEHYYA